MMRMPFQQPRRQLPRCSSDEAPACSPILASPALREDAAAPRCAAGGDTLIPKMLFFIADAIRTGLTPADALRAVRDVYMIARYDVDSTDVPHMS